MHSEEQFTIIPDEGKITAPPIDTNAEYIHADNAQNQPPVLKSVAKYIVVETLKDLFTGIAAFFLRYIKHFMFCIVYFWSPTLRKKPFDRMDFKQNSQHAFEFIMLIVLFLIFMIKVEWIPQSNKELLAIYDNDIVEKFMELFLFVIFALSYIVFAGLSLLTGRFFRVLFNIQISRRESDILFVYMNNAFFSFTAIIALFIRSVASHETHDMDSVSYVLMLIILPVVFVALILWAIRFAWLHKIKFAKAIFFFLMTTIVFGLFYAMSSLIICAFVVGL